MVVVLVVLAQRSGKGRTQRAISTSSIVLGVSIAVGLHAREVRAEPHQLCLYLDIGAEFWDASPRAADGEEFREEYGRNEGPTSYPAQRWLARVRDESTDAIVFGWRPLDGAGCAAFDLPPGERDLRVEWVRWAVWNDAPDTGNQLVGYRCDASMSSCDLDVRSQIISADIASGITEVVLDISALTEVDLMLWAASFAEERFASLGEQPLDEARIYLGYDPMNVLPGFTQADRTFGNQPSVVVAGESWRSKFTLAHELGHQQTMGALHPSFGPADIDYCHDPNVYPVAPMECVPNHSIDSHEWQAAAAIEGFADWYAVSAWNDVDLVECQGCQVGVLYVKPDAPDQAQTYAVPRGTSLCTGLNSPQCPAGVGNEWDWLSALRLFRLGAPSTPSFRSMFRMASATYATGDWPPNATTDAFWTSFDQAMAGHLGPNHAAWQTAALQMELNR